MLNHPVVTKQLSPAFVALVGARDRAAHEGKTVGSAMCHATVDLSLVAITEHCSDEIREQANMMVHNCVRILEHTVQILANDISRLASGQDTPASVVFKPTGGCAIVGKTDPFFNGMQQAFVRDMQTDDELAESLSHVTANIVQDWQR